MKSCENILEIRLCIISIRRRGTFINNFSFILYLINILFFIFSSCWNRIKCARSLKQPNDHTGHTGPYQLNIENHLNI